MTTTPEQRVEEAARALKKVAENRVLRETGLALEATYGWEDWLEDATAALAPQEAIIADLEAKVARLREAVEKARLRCEARFQLGSTSVLDDVSDMLAEVLNDQVQS